MKKTVLSKRKPLNAASKKLIKTGKAYYTHAVKPRDMVIARGKDA